MDSKFNKPAKERNLENSGTIDGFFKLFDQWENRSPSFHERDARRS